MSNYYQILGISESANPTEIKSAFRALAKLYHPDKNPDGQEHFKKILRAYETLINPSRKASYDLKLKYQRGQTSRPSGQNSGRKKWTFEEQELRRRQYYNDHIKKYAKTNYTAPKEEPAKSAYNEYKYILYATPVAVALFLLIINLATNTSPRPLPIHEKVATVRPAMKMGDSPYIDYFGSQQYNMADNKALTIKNQTGKDVVICLFNKTSFLRSCYIQDGYSAEIPQLPRKEIQLRYSSGKNWDMKLLLKEVGLYGAFSSHLSFYESLANAELGGLNEITLLGGINEGFRQINEKQFFRKY